MFRYRLTTDCIKNEESGAKGSVQNEPIHRGGTDAKPTSAKPTSAKPTSAKPTSAKPTSAKPTSDSLTNRLNAEDRERVKQSNELFNKTIGILDIFIAPSDHLVPFTTLPLQPGKGSGFFIGPNVVMTADHVIKDAVSITITMSRSPGGPKQYKCKTLYRFVDYDIAILGILDDNGRLRRGPHDGVERWIELDRNPVSTGQRVVGIGHPRGVKEFKVHNGTVNGFEDNCIVFDCVATHGNSGGLLARHESNRAIGVVSRGYLQENTNYAVPIESAIKYINSFKLLEKCNTGWCNTGWCNTGWCVPSKGSELTTGDVKQCFDQLDQPIGKAQLFQRLMSRMQNIVVAPTRPSFPIVFRAPKIGMRFQPWDQKGTPCLRVRTMQNRRLGNFGEEDADPHSSFFQVYGIEVGHVIKTIDGKSITKTGLIQVADSTYLSINDYIRTRIGESHMNFHVVGKKNGKIVDNTMVQLPLEDQNRQPYVSQYHSTRSDYEAFGGMLVKEVSWEVLSPLMGLLSMTKQHERYLAMARYAHFPTRNDPALVVTETLPGCPFSPNVAPGDILTAVNSNPVRTLVELRKVIKNAIKNADRTIWVETVRGCARVSIDKLASVEIDMIQRYQYVGHSTMLDQLKSKNYFNAVSMIQRS